MQKVRETYSLASIKSNLKNARDIFPWNENHYDFIKSEIIVKNLNFNEGKCNFHLEPLPKKKWSRFFDIYPFHQNLRG